MNPHQDHVATIRRNQERAVKILYLAKQNTAPDPERVARETMRIVDERSRRLWWQSAAISTSAWLAAVGLGYGLFMLILYVVTR